MTAGTVVITGGILATVILLCIISVLCYCRLQYYCCKKNGSDSTGSASPPHLACNSCSVPGLEAPPLSLSPPPSDPTSSSDPSVSAGGGGRRGYCPTCSPSDSPFYIRYSSDSDLFDPAVRNGSVLERGYVPTMHYENPALALPPLPASTLLREKRPGSSHHRSRHREQQPQPHFYANTRAISTDV